MCKTAFGSLPERILLNRLHSTHCTIGLGHQVSANMPIPSQLHESRHVYKHGSQHSCRAGPLFGGCPRRRPVSRDVCARVQAASSRPTPMISSAQLTSMPTGPLPTTSLTTPLPPAPSSPPAAAGYRNVSLFGTTPEAAIRTLIEVMTMPRRGITPSLLLLFFVQRHCASLARRNASTGG